MSVEDRVLIKRGNLAGTEGTQAAPGSGATITIFDSTTMVPQWAPYGLPFQRLDFSVISSANSAADGVKHYSSLDRGSNFDLIDDDTYATADGQTTYRYLLHGGHARITYENSASVLTVWRYELWGIYQRDPGQ